jgi:class 3 adenylate cyclase
VQRRVRGSLRLRFEGERQLSGREEPVHVYSVERESRKARPDGEVHSAA